MMAPSGAAGKHLVDTPRRLVSWLMEYSNGSRPCPPEDLLGPIFEDPYDEMIIVKDISFTALCAHHVLPFRGKAAVGYKPAGRIIGLSKLPRIVNWYAHSLTLQEYVTNSVADFVASSLNPEGVMVCLYDVEHQCMTIRGIKDPHASTTTIARRGIFKRGETGLATEFLGIVFG